MDTKIVRYILCRMLGVEAALLLVPVLVAVIYQEKCGIVFLIPIVILCLLFWVAGRKRPEHGQISLLWHGFCGLYSEQCHSPFPGIYLVM